MDDVQTGNPKTPNGEYDHESLGLTPTGQHTPPATISCPYCRGQVHYQPTLAGQFVLCPYPGCGSQFPMFPTTGQMELPSSFQPPAPAVDESFTHIEDNGTRPRRRRQPSYAGFWALALITLLGIGFAGLSWSGVVQFKLPRQEDVKEEKDIRASVAVSKPQLKKDRPQVLRDGEEKIPEDEQEKKEREIAETQRQRATEETQRQRATEETQRQNEFNRLLARLWPFPGCLRRRSDRVQQSGP
jgi:hypothetical protein